MFRTRDILGLYNMVERMTHQGCTLRVCFIRKCNTISMLVKCEYDLQNSRCTRVVQRLGDEAHTDHADGKV